MTTAELKSKKALYKKLNANAGQLIFVAVMVLTLVTNLRLLYVTSEISNILKGSSNNQESGSANKVVNVTWENAAFRGPKDAIVQIVEFADFQCPYCATSEPEIASLLKKYDGKILFAYRHFPLPNHSQAMQAAEASECAKEQGKFWEMHDLVFANQDTLDNDSYHGFAEQLEIDLAKFDLCMSEHRYAESILKDRSDGQSYGVTGVPTFFINGREMIGVIDSASFQRTIEDLLSTPESK